VTTGPSSGLARTCSIVTALRRLDLTIPRSAEADTLGRRTTLPSGCRKNLTRSPGFSRRCSRIALGIVAWPLRVIADSIVSPLLFTICNAIFCVGRQVVRQSKKRITSTESKRPGRAKCTKRASNSGSPGRPQLRTPGPEGSLVGLPVQAIGLLVFLSAVERAGRIFGGREDREPLHNSE
jgi:hypothetical protein